MQGTRMIALPAIILVIRMIILMLWYMPENKGFRVLGVAGGSWWWTNGLPLVPIV